MPKRRQGATDSRRSLAAKGRTRKVCESCRKSKIRCTGCAEFACEACTKKKILCIPATQNIPSGPAHETPQSRTGRNAEQHALDEAVKFQGSFGEPSAGDSQVEALAGEDVDENGSHISSFVGTAAGFELVYQDIMQSGKYTLMDHRIVDNFHLALLYFDSPSQPFVVRWKFDNNLRRWSYFDGPTELKKFAVHTDTNGIVPYPSVLQFHMLNDGEGTEMAKQEDIMPIPTAEGLSSSNTNQWESLTNGTAILGDSQSLGILEQWFESGSAIVPRPYVTDQSSWNRM